MLRYILKRETYDMYNGLKTHDYFTVDGDADHVEKMLSRGGSGEMGYDHTTFVGVEVITKPDEGK